MVQRTRAALAIGLMICLTPLLTKAADDQAGQQAKVFEKQVTVKLNYLLFLPEGYSNDSDKKWPAMLFLHGAGERGSDVNKVKVHGPPKIVQNRKDFPFIVVSPQCPSDSWWRPFELIALLDEIQSQYKVDPDRVYLTGPGWCGKERRGGCRSIWSRGWAASQSGRRPLVEPGAD